MPSICRLCHLPTLSAKKNRIPTTARGKIFTQKQRTPYMVKSPFELCSKILENRITYRFAVFEAIRLHYESNIENP
jgi:hypothetical protein